MVDHYTEDELRLIVDFYGRMGQAIRDHVTRLRGPAAPEGQAGPGEAGAR